VVPPGKLPAPTGADRTSMAAFLREDHPGALLEILTEFAVRGVNLTTIQSRPTGEGLGNYFFFIDCEGHIDDIRVGEAMVGLRRVCAEVRFLGSYPRSDGGRTLVRAGTSNQEFAEAIAWLGRLRFGRALSPKGGFAPLSIPRNPVPPLGLFSSGRVGQVPRKHRDPARRRRSPRPGCAGRVARPSRPSAARPGHAGLLAGARCARALGKNSRGGSQSNRPHMQVNPRHSI